MGNLLHLCFEIIQTMPDFVISNDKLNRNGYRVLTSGIRLEKFRANPVMTYNHNLPSSWGDIGSREQIPPGRWENLRINENNELVGTVVFNMKTDLGVKLSEAVEDGFINACSIGIQVITRSEDESVVLPGQRYETVTESELLEIAIVVIPGNADAVRLHHEGSYLNLSHGDENLSHVLPLIGENKKELKMTIDKSILDSLNLGADATELQVQTAIDKLKADANNERKKREALELKFEEQETAQLGKDAEAMVQGHIDRNALTADRKDFYLSIAKESSEKLDMVDAELKKIEGYERPTNQLAAAGATAVKAGKPDTKTVADAKEYYLNMDTGKLGELRQTNPARYAELEAAAELHPELLDYKKEE